MILVAIALVTTPGGEETLIVRKAVEESCPLFDLPIETAKYVGFTKRRIKAPPTRR